MGCYPDQTNVHHHHQHQYDHDHHRHRRDHNIRIIIDHLEMKKVLTDDDDDCVLNHL